MCPEIENPNPSRTQMAPRRTSHARRRPGQPESTPEPPGGRNSPGAVHLSSPGRGHWSNRGARPARCCRSHSTSSIQIRQARRTQRICRRDASASGRRHDRARNRAVGRNVFRAGIRKRNRVQLLLEKHDSLPTPPTDGTRVSRNAAYWRAWVCEVWLEAGTVNVCGAGASRRRRGATLGRD